MSTNPAPWHCVACKATDNVLITADRVLHIARGHIARVVDALDNTIIFERPFKVAD